MGKIDTDVVVFPQGRRERKDEGDPVETAMREYHEETGNFGALTEHLLRFYEDDAEDDQSIAAQGKSFIFYFNNARMVIVFCEVPAAAYERTLRSLKKEDFDVPQPAAPAEPAEPSASSSAGTQSDRKKKKPRRDPTASFKVGKENHLTPVWVSGDALKEAIVSLDTRTDGHRGVNIDVTVCPRQSVDGTGNIGAAGTAGGPEGATRRSVPFFPLNLSVFRQREARIWLGLPVSAPGVDEAARSPSSKPLDNAKATDMAATKAKAETATDAKAAEASKGKKKKVKAKGK